MTASNPEPARRRLLACVQVWPECEEGTYDPRCCRFPKSCSATVYDPALVADSDLEPSFPAAASATTADDSSDLVRVFNDAYHAAKDRPRLVPVPERIAAGIAAVAPLILAAGDAELREELDATRRALIAANDRLDSFGKLI